LYSSPQQTQVSNPFISQRSNAIANKQKITTQQIAKIAGQYNEKNNGKNDRKERTKMLH